MSTNERVDVRSILTGKIAVSSVITVKGWVRTRRDSKAGLSFIHVSDGSCFDPLQVVAPNTLANYPEVQKLTTGCSVVCHGQLVQSQGKGQSVEVLASKVEILGFVENPDHYPMQPKQHTLEYLRENAHLRPRTNTFGAVSRVRHTIAHAIHRFFDQHGFLWVNTPIITASDAEGA